MARRKNDTLAMTANTLTAVGALTWGTQALFDFNLVTTLFGVGTTLTTVVYGAVGVAGALTLWKTFMK